MNNNMTIGIIGAMDSEVALLHACLTQAEVRRIGDLAFHSGILGDKQVVVVRCGVGKVNAARCTQLLIDAFHPDYIVNTGIAGGIGEGLCVGDVVVATGLMQHDFDVTAFGYARGNLCNRKAADQPTIFCSDKALVNQLVQAAESVAPGRVKLGTIVTGDVFISSREQKQFLYQTFHAAAAEMEGGAIAQVAQANGIPFVVLRAISDLADGSAASSIETFERETADLSAGIIQRLVHQL